RRTKGFAFIHHLSACHPVTVSLAMTFYITTPIYYANSLPHLGHLYTMIVADTIARRKRQQGIETLFLTGTDEHGINIERAAQRNNRTPKEQADYVVS